ncbi:MAG: hypothetical protein J6A29_05780 [Clostridia bacterium]|nr:hypothetical protein [Clostridia bacterium]
MSAKFEKLMLEKMDKLSGDLNSFKNDITERLVNFEKFTIRKFEEHDKKFEAIDRRFEAIDRRFETIDRRFEAIDRRFETIDKKFDVVDKKFVSIDKHFDILDKQVHKLTEDMQVVKEAVILIEDKITREIPTLFDAYSMHQDKQERQDNTIDSLNLKVEDHDIRISCLEQKVI